MIHYIKILRPFNLIIVVLSQYSIFFLLIKPGILLQENIPVLSNILFGLFTLVTAIIAGTGYIVNDIFDQPADKINKSDKSYVGDVISPKIAWIYYTVLVLAGFLISLFISFKLNMASSFVIYPIAIILLFSYSYLFKHKVLLGNLIVSLFCAFVPGILWVVEKDTLGYSFSYSNPKLGLIYLSLFSYIGFAFLTNFIREIVKDIQDMEGDLACKSQTLPLKYGFHVGKISALFYTLFLSILVIVFIFTFSKNSDSLVSVMWGIPLLIIPCLYLVFLIQKSQEPSDCKSISKWLKILMAGGLIYLILLYI